MRIKQLSLFVENKPGHVYGACRTLADAGINIEAVSLADTEQFGILRLIVKNWEDALAVFEKKGITVKMTDVVAVVIENRPGGLADVLGILEQEKLNIEYFYEYHSQAQNQAILIFRFNDPDAAIAKIKVRGVQIADSLD